MSCDVGTEPRSQTSPEADDGEEVTETKIVGVTETGVIRKRSFKRKMTKEEKDKRQRYGQAKDEYAKIVDRVMGERLVTSTLEGLRERWKMISYMHNDCIDIVHKWENIRTSRLKAQRQFSFRVVFIVVVVFMVVMLVWAGARFLCL